MPQTVTDGALSWQRLAVKNAHPRDALISFEEETHTYTIKGEKEGWISCTGFIHGFFEEFNADVVISKMMASSKWPENKYYGKTVEEIIIVMKHRVREHECTLILSITTMPNL